MPACRRFPEHILHAGRSRLSRAGGANVAGSPSSWAKGLHVFCPLKPCRKTGAELHLYPSEGCGLSLVQLEQHAAEALPLREVDASFRRTPRSFRPGPFAQRWILFCMKYQQNQLKLIGSLKDGESVYDRPQSHLTNDDGFHAILLNALQRVEGAGRPFIEEEVAFDEEIGRSICVETTSDDVVVFAHRKNRPGLSRIVLNRQSEPCKSMFIVLKRIGEWSYLLITAFIGRRAQPEPFDEGAFQKAKNPDRARIESRAFWLTHALIFEEVELERHSDLLPTDRIKRRF